VGNTFTCAFLFYELLMFGLWCSIRVFNFLLGENEERRRALDTGAHQNKNARMEAAKMSRQIAKEVAQSRLLVQRTMCNPDEAYVAEVSTNRAIVKAFGATFGSAGTALPTKSTEVTTNMTFMTGRRNKSDSSKISAHIVQGSVVGSVTASDRGAEGNSIENAINVTVGPTVGQKILI
jgi:hypothetical protein